MSLGSVVLDVLFPPFCAGCSRIGTYLCADCFEQIEFLPLPIPLDLDPNYLDGLTAATLFEEPVKSLLHEYKYQSVRGIGQWCGRMLYETTPFPLTDVSTSVPLHHKRQRLRGFNQAEEIAVELAKLTKTSYQPLLKRIKHTDFQASITDRSQRLTHLQNCFEFIKPDQSIGSTVLLIDDVTTTGTTLNECAKVLKANGFTQVFGLVVAHGN
jgi:competence protein ComFC